MKTVQIHVQNYQTEAKARGLDLHLLSTYDVPVRVRFDCPQGGGVLHVWFDYIDEEPYVAQMLPGADLICAKVGKNSGKIRGFEIKVAEYGIGEVRVKVSGALESVSKALDEQIPHLKRFNQRANYALVSSVLSDRGLMAAAVQ